MSNKILEDKHAAKVKKLVGHSPTLMEVFDSPNHRMFIAPQENITPEPENWTKKEHKDVQDITVLLEALGYGEVDIAKGMASKDGKNFVKVGKILTKHKLARALKKWKKLTNQCGTGGKTRGRVLCVSLNPEDVLTASHNRAWRSCLRPGGSDYYQLGSRVLREDRFSFVVYCVGGDNTDTSNASGRMLVHAYKGRESAAAGERKFLKDKSVWYRVPKVSGFEIIHFRADTIYGNFPPKIRREVTRFLKKVNAEVYKKDVAAFGIGYYHDVASESIGAGTIARSLGVAATSKARVCNTSIDDVLFNSEHVPVKRKRRWNHLCTPHNINQGLALLEDLIAGKRVSRSRIVHLPVLRLYQIHKLVNSKAAANTGLLKHLKEIKSEEVRLVVENADDDWVKEAERAETARKIAKATKEKEKLTARLKELDKTLAKC